MRDLYFYTLVGGVILGAILGPLGFGVSLPSAGWLGLVAVVLLVVGKRGGGEAAAPSWFFCLPIFLLALALMLTRVAQTPSLVDETLEASLNESVTLEGVVVREPEDRERSLHLYVKIGESTVLVLADRLASVSYGDVVQISGTLKKPEAFATDFGRTFNYPGYLSVRGVGYMVSYADVAVLKTDQGNPLVAWLLVVKQTFLSKLEAHIPAPQVGLAEGLLLGVKGALGEEYETAFRKTGIMHIVVLSGYNIMLVVTFFMYVLAYVLPYRLRLLVGMGGILGFALLVGLSATVVRASVMAALLLLMRFGGLTHHILRALFVTGVVMLIHNPLLLFYDVGFQLSFLATFALIVLAPHVERWFHLVPTVVGVREFLVATVTTQLLVTPLIMYHIGEVSLVAIVVNVLVLPMVAVAMLLTFLTGVVGFIFPFLAPVVAFAAYWSLTYILGVANTFASFSFAAVAVPPFSITYLFSFYVLFFLLWWFYQRQTQLVQEDQNDYLARWTIVEDKT